MEVAADARREEGDPSRSRVASSPPHAAAPRGSDALGEDEAASTHAAFDDVDDLVGVWAAERLQEGAPNPNPNPNLNPNPNQP